MTAAQLTTLTPPAAITGFATETTLGLIKTAVELIDNAVSGAGFNITQLNGAAVPIGAGLEATAIRVTLPTDGTGVVKLGAGTAGIGKLTANSGVDIGDVDVTSVVPGTGATNLGKAEDAAHASGDVGVMALSVRQATAAALAGANADYQPLITDATGRLYVMPFSSSATEYTPERLTDGTAFLDTATLFDLDSGAGTQYVAGVGLRRAASGGSVEAGIPAYPIAVEKVDSTKATYSAVAVNIAPAASATDVFTITGSASKTVRILRIGISGIQTTAGLVNVILAKRSTANSGGTSVAATAVPNDSANGAATATVLSYTVNPTPGTLVGNVRGGLIEIGGAASVVNEGVIYDFGNLPGQCIVLRGTNQVLAVNLNGVTVTGGSMTYWVEWSEE